MKKCMFCLLSFLPLSLLATPLPLPNDVKTIDEEIQVLKSRLNTNRVEEMNEEVDGKHKDPAEVVGEFRARRGI